MWTRLFPPFRSLNVPNVVTSMAAACGVAAAGAALEDLPRLALTLLFGAIVCDRLDGVLARKLGQTSEIGRELDSLADAIGFGVAPAALAFAQGFKAPHELGLLIVYVLCAVWRLAHFNVTGLAKEDGAERFSGVPTTVVASAFFLLEAGLRFGDPALLHGALIGFFVLGSLLMVAALPFKKNGLVVKSLYLLLPLGLALLWLKGA
jgi:CDP-diacylglycerol--serine O-phosphatidyltransferase